MTPAKIQEQHPFSPSRGSHTVSPSRRKLYRKSRKKANAEVQPTAQKSLSESESDELPELLSHASQVPPSSTRNGTQIHNEPRQNSARVENKSSLSEEEDVRAMQDGLLLGDEDDPRNWEQNGNLGDNGNHYIVLPPISNRNDVDHLENGKNPLQSNQNLSVTVRGKDSESQDFVRLLLSNDLHDRDEAFQKTVQQIKKMEKFKDSSEEEIRMRIQRDLDEAKALVVPIAAAGSYRSGRFEAVTRKARRRSTSAMAKENFFTGKEERAQPSSFSDGQGNTANRTTSTAITTSTTVPTMKKKKKTKKKTSSNESKLEDRDDRARKPNETSPQAKRGQVENATDSKSKGSKQKGNRNDPTQPRQAEQSEFRMSPPKPRESGYSSSFMSAPRNSNQASSVKNKSDGSKAQSKKGIPKARPSDAESQSENDFDLNDNQIGQGSHALGNENERIETEVKKVEEFGTQNEARTFREDTNFSSLFPLRPDSSYEQSHYLNYGTTSTHKESGSYG